MSNKSDSFKGKLTEKFSEFSQLSDYSFMNHTPRNFGETKYTKLEKQAQTKTKQSKIKRKQEKFCL